MLDLCTAVLDWLYAQHICSYGKVTGFVIPNSLSTHTFIL